MSPARIVEAWRTACARTATVRQGAAWMLPPVVLVAWAWGVARTGRAPSGDGPHVLGTAMRLSQQLRDLELGTFAWCFSSLIGPHPPGAYVPAVGAYLVTGTTWTWSHLVAGAVVVWLCWDGVRRLGGGWAGAVWLAASPLVWLQAESYGIDLVGATCVVQCCSHLVASDGLSRRGHAAAFGAWMAAAFLGKYTAPMFLWAPCLVAAVWVVRGRRWRTLGIAIGVFCVLALPWYLSHLGEVAGYLGASRSTDNALFTNKRILSGPWYGAERLGWYPAVFLDALGWPAALCVALGAGWAARKPGALRGAWVVPAVAILGGWLILAMQTQRQDRYLLPVLPLAAALVGSSRTRWLTAPVGLMTVYGTAAVYLSWTDVPSGRSYEHQLAGAGQDWPWPQTAFQPTSAPASKWNLAEAVDALARAHGSDAGTVGFLLDEDRGAPGFGLVLSQVASRGYRWDIATVMLLQGGAPIQDHDDGVAVFVGPFTTDDWPTRDFGAMLAIVSPTDTRRAAWIAATGMQPVASWTLGQGLTATVYQSPTGPLAFGDPGM